MALTAILFFVFFTAVVLGITVKVVKEKQANELNPIMVFLLRWPLGFWAFQIVLTGISCYLIAVCPPWVAFFAVSARAINAYNDFLVYKGKIR